ncbi:MAG: copper resistance protein [Micromonosporaceae bacterium]|nr:copper resistance protein [Micromonosporaceae bacterium]
MWRRRVGAVAVAVTAFVVAARACSAPPAPVALTAVEPANGSVLTAAPVGVSLVFTAPVDARLVHLTVANADGVSVISGTPRPSGPRVVVPVTVSAGGRYVISYHVALPGGREATGLSAFTMAGDTAGTAVSRAGSTGRVPADRAAGGAAAAAGGVAVAAGGHVHGGKDPLSLALVLVDVALIVGVAALLIRRPRPR